MPLGLLDYNSGNIDFTIGANSQKCQLSSIAFDFNREVRNQPTFCSGNWSQNFNGVKSASFLATGYPAKGSLGAKPAQYFLADTYPTVLFTADTGCTIGMTATITRETIGMAALQNGSYSIQGVNYGSDLAVTWVTS